MNGVGSDVREKRGWSCRRLTILVIALAFLLPSNLSGGTPSASLPVAAPSHLGSPAIPGSASLPLPGSGYLGPAVQSPASPAYAPYFGILTRPSGAPAKPGPSIVTPGAGWNGIDKVTSGNWTPPDTIAAAGPTSIAEFVNLYWDVYTKSGTLLQGETAAKLFHTGDSLSDPQVFYDNQSGRWFVSLIDLTALTIVVQVSQTSDPTGAWFIYPISAGGHFPDQPVLGLNAHAFVISSNIFKTHGNKFLYSEYWIMNKTQMVAGPSNTTIATSSYTNPLGSVHPVDGIGPSNTIYLVSDSFGGAAITSLAYIAITGTPPAVPTVTQLNLPISPALSTPANPTDAGAGNVVVNDGRIGSAMYYDGTIWASANDGNTSTPTVARFYEINTSTAAMIQDFDWSPGMGVSAFYPAVAIDSSGDLGVIVSVVSSTTYAGVDVTGQSTGELPGTLESPVEVATGTSTQTTTRFGDYSGLSVDPAVHITFCGAGEWDGPAGKGGWNTWVQCFQVPPAVTYPVTFHVAPSSSGAVVFNGLSYYNTQTTSVPSGTYSLAYVPNPWAHFSSWGNSGGVSISPGSATVSGQGDLYANFTAYPGVTLLSNYSAACPSISFNGSTYSSGTVVHVFSSGPTYALRAPACTGYTFSRWTSTGGILVASPATNVTTATVTGNATLTENYTPTGTYTVDFTETGLPASTSWSVTLNGQLLTSTSPLISFTEPDGTYTYTVLSPLTFGSWKQYAGTPSAGKLTVSGAPAGQSIAFKEQFLLTMGMTPVGGGTATPSSGWYNASTIQTLTATAGAGYAFGGWVGSGPGSYSGTNNPDSLSLAGSDNETADFIATASYAVTFVETGLPAGTSWTVTLNGGSASSTTPTISFNEANGFYSYSVKTPISTGPWEQFIANPASGTLVVSGGSVNQPLTYTATFFLNTIATPAGAGSASPPSGWYAARSNVTLAAIPAGGYSFSGWSGSGPGAYTGPGNPVNLTMTGSVNESALFTPTTPLYSVTFDESGLTGSFTWWVTLNGVTTSSTSPSINFVGVAAGNYSYTVLPLYPAPGSRDLPSPSPGTINVSADAVQPITFTTQYYLMTYPTPSAGGTVSPSGGWRNAGISQSIAATPNAGYTFSGWAGSGNGSYSGTSPTANVTMNGSLTEVADFASATVPGTYPVTFTETGLASGTQWYVSLGGLNRSSGGSTMTIIEPHGSYPWSVASFLPGTYGTRYAAAQASGSITVNGTAVTVIVTYSSQYYLTTSASPPSYGTVTPTSGWFTAGSTVELHASALAGYVVVAWSGSGTGNYSGVASVANISLAGPIGEVAAFAPASGMQGSWVSGLVNPATAMITLDGKPVKVSPGGNFNQSMAPGTYTVVASATGYQSITTVVSLGAGSGVRLNLTLQARSTPGPSGTDALIVDWLPLVLGIAVAAVAIILAIAYGRKGKKGPEVVGSQGKKAGAGGESTSGKALEENVPSPKPEPTSPPLATAETSPEPVSPPSAPEEKDASPESGARDTKEGETPSSNEKGDVGAGNPTE